jgi:ElaB/YqjD/DUF883 family membrane-anchored ribosome-binding protein
MSTTAENTEQTEPTLARLHAAGNSGAGADREVEALIADAEALADRLLAASNPAIAQLGRRLGAAVSDTRLGVVRGTERIQLQARRAAHVADEQARRAARAADQYAHERPWPVVGAVALMAAAIGFAVARR